MRRLFVLAVFAVLAVVPSPARANSVTLWACHGPAGGALPFGYTVSGTFEASFSTPNDGCGAAGGTIRLGFLRPDPGDGHFAALRFATPAGVTVDRVWLGRHVSGPGYWARTSTTELESLDTPSSLDGVFSAAVGGQWVELGIRCATDPAARCDAAGTAVDFRFAALTVRDEAKPTFSVNGVPGIADGTLDVIVDARDTGLGLVTTAVTLGGAPAAALTLGQGYCSELSPADNTVDLPLAEDCPTARRMVMPVDTTRVADGTHRLEITVADSAGNATVRGYDVKVLNHPPTAAPTPTPPAPRRPVADAPSPSRQAAAGVLRVPKHYTVSRTGSFKVAASCPAAAPASCKLSLKLSARLPGRKKAATIATGRTTAKPGARATITLKLSSSARSALAKKRKLNAVLTLAGAAPVTVKLQR